LAKTYGNHWDFRHPGQIAVIRSDGDTNDKGLKNRVKIVHHSFLTAVKLKGASEFVKFSLGSNFPSGEKHQLG